MQDSVGITAGTAAKAEGRANSGMIKWVDIAKAICIISMVIGHSGGPFIRLIYMFHMPAFLILSGFTYTGEKYSLKEYVKKKFITLVIPMLVINLLYICFYKAVDLAGIYHYFSETPYTGIKYAFKIFITQLGAADFGGATWFLVALFWAEVAYKTIQVVFKQFHVAVAIGFLTGLLGYFTSTQSIFLPYLLDLGLYAVLFFTVGVVLRRYNVLARIQHAVALPVAVACVWFFSRYYFASGLPMNWPTRQFDNPVIQLVSVMACFYLIYLAARALENVRVASGFLQYTGRHTFAILVLHFFVFRLLAVILVLCRVLPDAALQEFPLATALIPWWWLVAPVTVLVCLLCAWIAGKNRVLNYIINATPPKPKKESHIKKLQRIASARSPIRYAWYALLLFGLYFCLLLFVFPGHFSPLVPHHSDIIEYPFDMPISTLWQTITKGSRPTGAILTWFFGLFGTYRGVMVSGMLCTFVSMLLMVYCIEKEMGRKLWLFAVAVYFFFIMSSPSFYLNYTFDMYNVYALLFAALTLAIWYHAYDKRAGAGRYLLVALVSLLGFLSKETYIVSILAFFFFKVFLEQGKYRKRAIGFFAITLSAGAFSMLRSRLNQDVFAGLGNSDPSHPYYSSFAPGSIFKTGKFYANGFSNPWVVFILVVSAALLVAFCKNRRKALSVVALSISGLFAYVPYLVLPNRTIIHSFYIAYLMAFVPILAVSPQLFGAAKKNIREVAVPLLAVLVVLCGVGSVEYYKTSTGLNSYTVANIPIASENAMRLTLQSVDSVNAALVPGDKVLILGIEDTMETAYRSIHAGTIVRGDVEYTVAINEKAFEGIWASNVLYQYVGEIDAADYDVIVMYAEDAYSIERT